MLMAKAVNAPDELDKRRRELRARIERDPLAPPVQRTWTPQEMDAAVGRLMALNWKTAKNPPS